MISARINTIFQKATRKALVGWETDLETTELINELWAWYLASPYIQKTLDSLSEGEAVKYARKQAFNILTKEIKDRDLFGSRTIYSSDSIKDALLDRSSNRHLKDILPVALRNLDNKNPGYAEAIRARYTDGEIPSQGSGAVKLSRAMKALTEQVNITALVAGSFDSRNHSGPKLRHAVMDPELRTSGGQHSDPTANMALALLTHPQMREEYLHETSLQEFLRGKG